MVCKNIQMRHLLKYVLVLPCVLAFYACSSDTSSLNGTWLLKSDGDSLNRGFTLGTYGIAASVNNPQRQYNHWHKKKDTILLTGKLFDNTSISPLNDTLIIKKFTNDSLVVVSRGKKLRFYRE